MKNIYVACIASMLALGSVSALAADLTPDERSELRQRADGLRAQQQREPAWDGGQRRVSDTRMNDSRGDVRLDQNRGEAKTNAHGGKPGKAHAGKAKSATKSKTKRVKERVKRTAKDMPGALVRK
jgi:hypothetical protein